MAKRNRVDEFVNSMKGLSLASYKIRSRHEWGDKSALTVTAKQRREIIMHSNDMSREVYMTLKALGVFADMPDLEDVLYSGLTNIKGCAGPCQCSCKD